MIDVTQQDARLAIEALRAGVPNRAAIRLLGTQEPAIEAAFTRGLDEIWNARPAPGNAFAGGFGTGKSHLLGYLREAALRRNFVVSWITVSKETPLSQPGLTFAAAMRGAMVPNSPDDVVTVVLEAIQRLPGTVQGLELWASTPNAGLAPVFAAVTHLLARNLDPELVQGIEAFLAGGKPPTAPVRKQLAALGARGMFELGKADAATLQAQRPRFMIELIRAAGFAGWCVLIDEVELIGRYSPNQRAVAYGELARWLGLAPEDRIPGLHTICAITDDFADQVIGGRQDDEKLPERLRLKSLPQMAERASAAMEKIKTAPLLRPQTDADLVRHGETLRRAYTLAYGWDAPAPEIAERLANRTMRHHVRGWMTQWDMLRLLGEKAGLDVTPIAPDLTENEDFAVLARDDDES